MYFVAHFGVENVAQNIYVAHNIRIIVAHNKNMAQFIFTSSRLGKNYVHNSQTKIQEHHNISYDCYQ